MQVHCVIYPQKLNEGLDLAVGVQVVAGELEKATFVESRLADLTNTIPAGLCLYVSDCLCI